MRVLLVTRDDPYEALTGVATYVRDLAGVLTMMGNEVAHLYSKERPWLMRPHLNWAIRRNALTAILCTPPALRSSLEAQLKADVSSLPLERCLEEVLERVRPDVLHIHDFSDVPAALVTAARTRQCPVVVTLHDFWPFCRQFLLIRPGLVPCTGSEGGRNCALHCSQPISASRRALEQVRAVLPPRAKSALRHVLRLHRQIRKRRSSQFIVRVSSRTGAGPDSRIAQAYALRETSMRETVLGADCLLTVSHFAKAMYVRHGYPEERLRVLPLSLRSAERVQWRPRSFQGYPVRFGYLGRVTPWKGAHLLAEAARRVDPHLARFTFYGAVEDEDRDYLIHLSEGHPGLCFAGRYGREDLPSILEEIDVAVFPSVMSETLGLVGMEAQAGGIPIIGSDHGAIAECVRPGVNGLLFPVGDAAGLHAQILHILREPEIIARLSLGTSPLAQMDEHVRDVIRAYAEAREKLGGGVPGFPVGALSDIGPNRVAMVDLSARQETWRT